MKRLIKTVISVLCCAVMLTSLCAVGVSADNGLVIWDEDVRYLPIAEEIEPLALTLPDNYMDEDLVWSVEDESLVQIHYPEYEFGYSYYQAVAAGTTTLTATTKDGKYTDSVTLVIMPSSPWDGETMTIYTNARYQARTFEIVAPKTGFYTLTFDTASTGASTYGVLYSTDFVYQGSISFEDEQLYMEEGVAYYLYICGYDLFAPNLAFDVALTYVGEWVEEENPNSIVFADEEITMVLGETLGFPTCTFEPGGFEWYGDVTYSVDKNSILSLNHEYGTMSAKAAGTATVTVKADDYGWTDTVTVTVVEQAPALSEDNPVELTVCGGDERMILFTAPASAQYSFYSDGGNDNTDTFCTVYDLSQNEELAHGDDVGESYHFSVTVSLEKGQTVQLTVGAFSGRNDISVHVVKATPATGVKLTRHDVLAQEGNTMYIYENWADAVSVVFLGGEHVTAEEYEITVQSDNAEPDEWGGLYLVAGQSAVVTVTTVSGFTDSITVVAVAKVFGDLNFDGEVGLADAMLMYGGFNGTQTPTADQLAARELTGDNKVTLLDMMRMFYYINGQIQAL